MSEGPISAAFFSGHTTNYFSPTASRVWWQWTCSCGETFRAESQEQCVAHTNAHWAEHLNALIAPLIQAARADAAAEMRERCAGVMVPTMGGPGARSLTSDERSAIRALLLPPAEQSFLQLQILSVRIEEADKRKHVGYNSPHHNTSDCELCLEHVSNIEKRISIRMLDWREAQRRSFAFGNCNIENPKVTREIVNEEAEKMATVWDRRYGPHPEISQVQIGQTTDRLVEAVREALQMVRGKFQLANITHNFWNTESKTLRFQTVYDPSIPEDRNYAKATPSGSIEMQVDNPSALAKFELGKYYYVDFTPIE